MNFFKKKNSQKNSKLTKPDIEKLLQEAYQATAPFKKVTEKIMTEFSDLNLCPINNRQGIVIDGEDSKVICKD